MTVVVGTPSSVALSGAGNTVTIPDLVAVPVGDHVVVGTIRSTVAADVNGVSSVTVDTNAAQVQEAHANRSSTFEVGVHLIPISDAVEAGDDVEVTWTSANFTKSAIAVPLSGLATPTVRNARTDGVPGLGADEVGANGAGSSPVASLALTGSGEKYAVAVVGMSGQGTTVTAHPTGWTLLGFVPNGNRALALYGRVVAGAETVSLAGMSFSGSVGWAAAIAGWESAAVASSTAVAGADQTVDAGETFTLEGSGSEGATGYTWAQLSPASPVVALSGSGSSRTGVAPAVSSSTPFVFRLTTTPGGDTDDVTVTVRPPAAGHFVIDDNGNRVDVVARTVVDDNGNRVDVAGWFVVDDNGVRQYLLGSAP